MANSSAEHTQRPDFKQWALNYAAHGLAVFPLWPKEKTPTTKNGFKNATTDTKQIEKWWNAHPADNIGIATGDMSGGLLVIDLDYDEEKGKDGYRSLQEFEKEHGELPNTWKVKTGRGGLHMIYHTDRPLPCTDNIRNGVDTRANGGYIVAPPSIHPNGNRYEWEASGSPDEVKIAEANDLIFKFISFDTTEKHDGEKKKFTLPDKIPKGYRGSTLVKLVCSQQARGLSDKAIRASVKAENEERCEPPFTDEELEKEVFTAIGRYEKGTSAYIDKSLSDDSFTKSFYKWSKAGNPIDIVDAEICYFIVRTTTFFLMGKEPYIYKDNLYRYDKDGNILKRKIQDCIVDSLVNSNRVTRVYNLILIQDKVKQFDELNQYPAHWISAQNGMYDPIDNKLLPHDPKYLCINQIPIQYIAGTARCPYFHNFIETAIPDADSREMLLEYFGLCLTRDTRQQKFMILKGMGGTGKSTLIRIIENIVGSENCSSISLQQLNQRFYSFGLVGKLLNTCADIPSEAMKAVDTLKKITGEDTLQAEAKGKDAFYFKNYAKLLFSANNIPLNLDETTTAFYRRTLIVTMDQQPKQADRGLYAKLETERNGIFLELIAALQRLYKRGYILESEASKAAVMELYHASDTVQAFLDDCMIADVNEKVSREDFFEEYKAYCEKEERQPLTRNNLYKNLRAKGYTETKDRTARYFIGIGFKSDRFMAADEKDIPFHED